jgi:hypothetical protein
MNDRKERDIKSLLSREFSGIMLTNRSKRRIKNNMTQMLVRRRLPLLERIIISMREFWHSTFEISVAPAALSAAAVVMLVFLAIHPGFAPINKPIKGETIYVQSVIEQHGTQTVVYMPIDMEVIDDANN